MPYRRCLICFVLLTGLLVLWSQPVYSQTPSNTAYPFAFMPAPSVLDQEAPVSGPDRVYIMEDLKPTFNDGELQIADKRLAAVWQDNILSAREAFKNTSQMVPPNSLWQLNAFVNNAHTGAAGHAAPDEDWRTPAEFFNDGPRHAGDYAMTKYYALKALGVGIDDLCLAFVKEPSGDALHVILIVRWNDEFFLLDSVSDQVFHNGAPKEYLPQYYINETTSWKQKSSPRPVAETQTNTTSTVFARQDNRPENTNTSSNKNILKGFEFDITPPPGKDTGVNIHKWKRICEEEDRFPSFKGPSVNISDQRKAAEWGRLYGKFRTASLNKKIVAVNDFFNQWAYKSDPENWGQKDYWATPREFMEKSGDCEDYAIAKYFALRALNMPSNSICLVWVTEAGEQDSHMVLIVLDKDDFYVLDNNTSTNTIYKNSGLAKYKPIFYMNEDYAWKPAK